MKNVILFAEVKRKKVTGNLESTYDYHASILGMDRLELIEEMVRFQEERTRLGELTPELIAHGQILFKALENSAETDELRDLSRTYRRVLSSEARALRAE